MLNLFLSLKVKEVITKELHIVCHDPDTVLMAVSEESVEKNVNWKLDRETEGPWMNTLK